jgi:hypothetical protein
LDPAAEQAVELHLQDCIACRAEMDGVSELCEKLLRDGRIMRETSMGASVLERISRENARHEGRSSVAVKVFSTRAVKVGLLAASIPIFVTVLFLLLVAHTVARDYALSQTLEANKGVRTIHLKMENAGNDEGSGEIWAQFGDDGEVEHIRWDCPKSPDGPKIIVWQNGQAEAWMKQKKTAVIVRKEDILLEIKKSFFDPKLAIEELRDDAAAGTAKIETKPPSDKAEPITLVVTRAASPETREEYLIDPDTKLLREQDVYKIVGGAAQLQSRKIFLDYNKPMDPSLFVLELPEDVMVLDQTSPSIGLAKGDRTNEEAAMMVAREFCEALIAHDSDKASRLFGGLPASLLEKRMSAVRYLGIVSVGKPKPAPNPNWPWVYVLCEVSIEMRGVTYPEKINLQVGPVEGQPDRWVVMGGF